MNGRLENELKIKCETEKLLINMPYFVTEWFLNLVAGDNTAATCKDYVIKVYNYLKYINEDTKNIKIEDINSSNITSYFVTKQTKKTTNGVSRTSDSYRQTLWYCFNNFFEFLIDHGYIEKNYLSSIKKTKNNDLNRINQNRILLTKKDFNKMIASVQNGIIGANNNMKERDILILLLFMTTGMRETALSNINIDDIDFVNNKLYVIDKGDKIQDYYLSDKLMKHINDWLEIRDNKNTNALFVSQKGGRLSSKAIYYLIKKYSEDALGYSVSPHKLRAGFVSIMYSATKDIETVRRAVGHANIATTQRYIVTKNDEREMSMNTISDMLKI